MLNQTITVATRPTTLAIVQTNIVIAALKKKTPALKFKIIRIRAKGDKDKRTTLWQLKSAGFFTSQVEDALLDGRADIAVHSFKDLPTKPRDGLIIAAVINRNYPEDCLVGANPVDSLDKLPECAKIGTSSLRRAAQIKNLRPDLQVLPIRGNVPTRIGKVERGDYDAVVLARAGLERLGLSNKICFSFDPAQFVPAPAQGALAVQVRSGDKDIARFVKAIDEQDDRLCCLAERAVLERTGAGCHAPVGAFAKITENSIVITAFISDANGTNLIKRSFAGPIEKNEELAKILADELLLNGGREILKNLKK
jgi:hydroxymethylbilane synthase